MSPGVPDLYQGTEFWDFSLVDPDNRRAIDYACRHEALQSLKSDEPDVTALLADWKSGRIKQAVLSRLLDIRRRFPQVFLSVKYIFLPFQGYRSANVQIGRASLREGVCQYVCLSGAAVSLQNKK